MKKTFAIIGTVSILLLASLFLSLSSQSQTVNMGRTYVSSQNVRYANNGATGTTLNKLAKLTGAPSTATLTAITDTSGIIGIVVAGAGTTGSADIAFKGKAICVFDSATTAGHYVTNDTSTAGDCMDAGATYPTSGQVIGVVTSTNGGAGTYEVDLTLGQPQAGGSGGGGGESVIAIGALPGTCTDGTAFSLTDSLYRVVCNPTNTFNYFYGSYKVTPPLSAGWSWMNQGGGTIDSTNGYEAAYFPRSGATEQRARMRAKPAGAYTIIAGYLWEYSGMPTVSATNGLRAGVSILIGDGTKFLEFRFGTSSSRGEFEITTAKWNSFNSFSAPYIDNYSNTGGSSLVDNRPFWLKIVDDNTTNITWYWSIDRFHWNLFDQRARTDFLVPSEVGFGSYVDQSDIHVSVIDWTVTSP